MLSENPDPLNETVSARLREVFHRDQRDDLGDWDSPTTAGFMELARSGREAWNLWRGTWPKAVVNFARVDFRGENIDFAGFVFGQSANFSGSQFGDDADFGNSQFGQFAHFGGATFGGGATFKGAAFGDGALFSDAKFGSYVDFVGTQFDISANFVEAKFGDHANFDGAQFGPNVRFDRAVIGDFASFAGTQFDSYANFIATTFGHHVSFSGWDARRIENFWRNNKLEIEARKTRAEQSGLRSDAFRAISFAGARFAGAVSFQNREFLATADFGPVWQKSAKPYLNIPDGQRTQFLGVPDFHGCKLHQDTSFEQAEFLAPSSAEAARAFRTLKLAMAQQQATREEQAFFRREMDAEAEVSSVAIRRLFKLYKNLSNYGFSLTRPLVFWLAALVFFGGVHGLLADWHSAHREIDWQRTLQCAQYVLFNALPLPGFDKLQSELRTTLFGPGEGMVLAAIVIDILHKTCVLLSAFLIGLALRNLFKMKG